MAPKRKERSGTPMASTTTTTSTSTSAKDGADSKRSKKAHDQPPTQPQPQPPSAQGLQLPITRVKKLCKEEADIRSMTQDATILITKATELFLAKLASEAHQFTVNEKRKTLLYRDLANAVKSVEQFDFLTDIVPQTRTKRELVRELLDEAKES